VLHEFLHTHRERLIERCRSMVALRMAPRPSSAELEHGVPLFLDQLIETLQVEQALDGLRSQAISGPPGGGESSRISVAAALNGRELLRLGFTVDQVVHCYGDLCQAITDLAFTGDAPIEIEEFRTLNRCLDNAMAGAVAAFASERDLIIEERDAFALNERLGFFAHELRNLMQTATLALAAIKSGNVGLAGATGAVLDRSLIGLRNLVDRSLADVRVFAGMPPRKERVSMADFIVDMKVSGALEAQSRQCGFSVAAVDPAIAVYADRELLASALGNLLQNAFKYTGLHTDVLLRARAEGERVLIEVEDHCGGLHPGDVERMAVPFTQLGDDRSGVGLGLAICRRSVEANGGELRVRNVPGSGCVFTIDLPRYAQRQAAATTPP
jgi:signal transduction histidine kinase